MDEKRIIRKYIHWRCILVRGHSEVSLLWSVLSQTLIVWLAIRDSVSIHRIHALWILPLIMILALIVQFVIGWVWEKKKLVDAEQKWIMDRTEAIQELLNKKENKCQR